MLERQHMVNNPIIINDDIEIHRRMFWEASLQTGIIVDFYNCYYDKSDFNQDPNLKWEDAITLPVIFDDAPKVKILKNYGWFTEDDERPQLVYLPMYKDWSTKELLDVKENSLIRVYYYGNTTPSEFRIMDKKLDSIYGVHWICKLAPERFNDFELVQEDGTKFLKRRDYRTDNVSSREIDKQNGAHSDYTKTTDDMREYNNDSYVDNIVFDKTSDKYLERMTTNTEDHIIKPGGTGKEYDNDHFVKNSKTEEDHYHERDSFYHD